MPQRLTSADQANQRPSQPLLQPTSRADPVEPGLKGKILNPGTVLGGRRHKQVVIEDDGNGIIVEVTGLSYYVVRNSGQVFNEEEDHVGSWDPSFLGVEFREAEESKQEIRVEEGHEDAIGDPTDGEAIRTVKRRRTKAFGGGAPGTFNPYAKAGNDPLRPLRIAVQPDRSDYAKQHVVHVAKEEVARQESAVGQQIGIGDFVTWGYESEKLLHHRLDHVGYVENVQKAAPSNAGAAMEPVEWAQVLFPSGNFEFNTNQLTPVQAVGWSGSNDDIPDGSVGEPCQMASNCMEVEMASRLWKFEHNQLRALSAVRWAFADTDIPQGAIGHVLRFVKNNDWVRSP
jgi:hypothetical protein